MFISANHILTFYNSTGDNYGFTSSLSELINQFHHRFSIYTFCLILHTGQQTGFCIIRYYDICTGSQVLHMHQCTLCHPIIEFPVISHDGVGKNKGSLLFLFLTVMGNQLSLLFRYNKPRGNGIIMEPQILPHFQCVFHILCGFHNFKLTIIQCIRYQRRRQCIQNMPHMSQYRHHSRQSYLTIARKIVNQ